MEWRSYHPKYNREMKKQQPALLFIGDSILGNWQGVGLTSWNRDFRPCNVYNTGIAGDPMQNILWGVESGEYKGI